MKSIVLFIFITVLSVFSGFSQSLSPDEKELYELIQQYRQRLGMARIPLSRNLSKVAQLHARDLELFFRDSSDCNMHSWSPNGPWASCCYLNDHSKASCMWSKPRELTSYKGNGYEIVAYYKSSQGPPRITPEEALALWKKSKGHHALIINTRHWSDHWQAMGVGMYGSYAVVWFGNEPDTE